MATRLSFGDLFFPLNWNFYLPAVAMTIAGVFFALFAKGNRVLRLALGIAVLALGASSFLQEQPVQSRGATLENASATAGFTVMSYNVMAYAMNEQGVLETIHDANPDVLCLVEGTFGNWAPAAVKRKLGKSYHWCVGERLSVASRLPVVESQQVITDSDSKLFRVVVTTDRGPAAIYVVDMDPPMRRDDTMAFMALGKALVHEELPAIIVGDFNIPRGSRHLRKATEGWDDAFLGAAASRYVATWPSIPVPIWQIDHAFTRGLSVKSASVINSTASDHRPIFVICSLPESGPPVKQ